MSDQCLAHDLCCCNAARAFAMFGIAIAASQTARLEELPKGYSYQELSEMHANLLRTACMSGQVTTIVPDPAPYVYILATGEFGTVRGTYGVWLERKASFYGTRPSMRPSPLKEAPADLQMPEGETHGDA